MHGKSVFKPMAIGLGLRGSRDCITIQSGSYGFWMVECQRKRHTGIPVCEYKVSRSNEYSISVITSKSSMGFPIVVYSNCGTH